MAFDNPTRARLARFVTDAREVLASEFTEKFQRLYGLSPSGEVTPIDKLKDLDYAQLATTQLLRERLAHLVAANPTARNAAVAAVDRLSREQAFTILNRLAAVRMAEKRGLIQESVGRGYESNGFRVYSIEAGSCLGEMYHRYRRYLFCLFDELAVDLGVLFDRRSPSGLLFPRESCLLKLLDLLNSPDLEALWAEDETIGWIYQYWNDPEERRRMRDPKQGGSAAPRNSRELAVRNQFFTPRYVVEFLADNTLGQIWYEMTQGQTKLKDQCRCLVRHPNESFLKPGEQPPAADSQPPVAPKPGEGGSTLNPQPAAIPTQEELLRQPVHIPHRPIKDPRTILMLDPACGSMHFGLYAFDLFEVIYEEAWDLEQAGRAVLSRPPGMKSLHETYPDKHAFLRDVPKLIIEHNIHGIDIDSRCVQIAGLSLWLRAQRAWKDQKIPAADRPRITRSNIVCAEPMPGEKDLLRDFVEQEFRAEERGVFLRLLETIFDQMQLAGEAGSLLKIEEEVRTAIEEAKQAWEKLQYRPAELFSTSALNAVSKQPELDATADLRSLASDFWQTAESRLLAALRDYAEQAETGGGLQRRLFAEDAARGFAFIDVCRKRYDVALMNPPFGVATDRIFERLKTRSPDTYTEMFASFVARGLQALAAGGLVGAITSRAFLTTKRLHEWRKGQVLRSIELLLDLGGQVMDSALVESCAYILKRSQVSPRIRAIDARSTRGNADMSGDCDLLRAKESKHFSVNRIDLERLPGAKLLYSIPGDIHELLRTAQPFEPLVGTVRQGMGTFDDFRFVHLRWEVPADMVGRGMTWEPLAKGGEYARYYSDIHLVLNWASDGKELGEVNIQHNGQVSQVRQASDYWRKAGCTYSKRSQKGFSARALPSNCIITGKGPAILTLSEIPNDYLLGWLNSRLITFLIELQANYAEFNTGILKALPWKQPPADSIRELARGASDCALILRDLDGASETTSFFVSLDKSPSLAELTTMLNSKRITTGEFVADHSRKWDQHVDTVYAVDSSSLEKQLSDEVEESNEADADDEPLPATQSYSASECVQRVLSYLLGDAFGRWDIRYATGEKSAPELLDPFAPLPVCPPGQLQNAQGLPARPEDLPAAYPIKNIPWDGILVDDAGHPLDIESRIRRVIEIIWQERAEPIENEACEVLGVNSLRDHFRKPAGFFADHLKRYSKSRRQAPIYWPLSTASGSYTLWIYYHRLTDQTLHTALADFVDPKIKTVDRDIEVLRGRAGGGGSQIGESQEFLDELRDFRAEIERIIKLPWKPNLNDGVLITSSPLWKLFRLPKWRKDLEVCWKELERGDYDWAHLAYSIWPGRVKEKCKTDRSLAIAHSLEDLCLVKAPPKKTKKQKAQMDLEESE